jgi:hypothetical protein
LPIVRPSARVSSPSIRYRPGASLHSCRYVGFPSARARLLPARPRERPFGAPR